MKSIKHFITKKTLITSLITMSAFAAFSALADPAKGLEIAEQRKAVDMGWGILSRQWKCYFATNRAKAVRA